MSLVVKELVRMGEIQLEKADVPNPKLDAELLYCFMKGIDKTQFIMEWSDLVEDRICEQYFSLISLRATRKPLQQITGTQDFMGMTFEVRDDVLIPRGDTEPVCLWAERIIKEEKAKTVLDLCCGSGILGIALARRNPGIKVTSTDQSAAAKALTQANAKRNGVKVEALQGDLFEPVRRKSFQMIVSNPPYIPSAVIDTLQEEVRGFEPMDALDGGEDGLTFYRRIAAEAPMHLKNRVGWYWKSAMIKERQFCPFWKKPEHMRRRQ